MFKGNDQKVYLNGKLLATLTKAEAKLKLDYEEMDICGQYEKEYEYVGCSIEGTLTIKKVNSDVLALYHEATSTGDVPELVITGVNLDHNGKNESVTIQNAKVTEISLLNTEAAKVTEEEIPFNASRYKVNSLIA